MKQVISLVKVVPTSFSESMKDNKNIQIYMNTPLNYQGRY